VPRSLEPSQIGLPFELSRGLLIGLPNPSAKNSDGSPDSQYETLRFQYNPETVTRARTGQWERKLDKKTDQAAQEKQAIAAARGGAIKAKSEVISFKLVFDAAELILRGGDTDGIIGINAGQAAFSMGILPELALLERYALGPDQMPDPPKKDNEFALVSLAPTEALLLLGPRTFPGVISQMNIVEQRFTPDLVPIRAEVDIRFRVLEARSIAVSKDTQQAFEMLISQRAEWAAVADMSAGKKDLYNAVSAAVAPRSRKGTS
jgi:hypothetical protein